MHNSAQESTTLNESKTTAQPGKAAKAANTNKDLLNLPDFARAAWSTNFLPTLYDCLGCSSDPFVINPNMVNAIQDVVDFVYPGSQYRVRANDKLSIMVCCY
jgi:hypothetical protein